MGGQACIVYGGAEFSRDIDLLILADEQNLTGLRTALSELEAEAIAVPPFDSTWLNEGMAVHFRCKHPEVAGLRLDLMSCLRNFVSFQTAWDRRTTIHIDGETVDLLSLQDLVTAKKTQRDKDWPMIRRLVETNYFANTKSPSIEQVRFWLKELQNSALLIAVANRFPDIADEMLPTRHLLHFAKLGDEDELQAAIHREELDERSADKAYWKPLLERLAVLRRDRQKPADDPPKPN
jgi:hypothetical protein